MAVPRNAMTGIKPRIQKTSEPSRAASGRGDAVEGFFWNIISINSDFEEISFAWSQMLGINVHQWMILAAIKELDPGTGVSVKDVSAKLHADPSIVTSQSKSLERHGFVRRISSSEDARVVLMSLTTKASKEIAGLHATRDSVKESIFSDLSDGELREVNETLSKLRERFRRAAKRLAAEL